MAAYDFPDTAGKPTDGSFEYTAPDGTLYEWNGYAWVVPSGDDAGSGGGGAARVLTQVLPPSPAQDGDMYWCTDDGRLYLYYDDADTSQWVDASPDNKAGSDTGDTYWERNGTTLEPANAGDGVLVGVAAPDSTSGKVFFDTKGRIDLFRRSTDTVASECLQIHNTSGTKATVLFNDGSGTFAGDVSFGTNTVIEAAGPVKIERSTGSSSCLSIRTTGAASTSARINADGSATFANSDFQIESDGLIRSMRSYNNTSSGPNDLGISAGGALYRSTSSIRYKKDVETIENRYSESILNCRPVYYRSTCEMDDPSLSHWGFIAEEVGEIDPRLVKWSDKEDGTKQADGVAYDRFVPHLVNLIKSQNTRIETLEETNASLEARLTALEGGSN